MASNRKFRTPYNLEKDDNFGCITCPGTLTYDLAEAKKTGEKKVEPGYDWTYKEVNDEKGMRHLVISGRDNVYDKIQSFKDDVDIEMIVKRCTAGHIELLDPNLGFYADVSSMPKSYNEYHNKFNEGKRIFDGLPIDFKEEFGTNVNTFMNSIYDKTFEKKYSDYVARKQAEANAFRNQQVVDNNSQGGVDNNDK